MFNTPPVAIFIEAIQGKAPEIEDKATNEAMKVLNAIRIYGYYNKPKFDDIITRSLVDRRFNWQTLCSTMKEDQEKWFIKDFVEAYTSFNTEKQVLINDDTPEKLKEITEDMFDDA